LKGVLTSVIFIYAPIAGDIVVMNANLNVCWDWQCFVEMRSLAFRDTMSFEKIFYR
jgi:hypothetical protein